MQLVARSEGDDVGVAVAAAADAHAHTHSIHALARARIAFAAYFQFLNTDAHAQAERGTPLISKKYVNNEIFLNTLEKGIIN